MKYFDYIQQAISNIKTELHYFKHKYYPYEDNNSVAVVYLAAKQIEIENRIEALEQEQVIGQINWEVILMKYIINWLTSLFCVCEISNQQKLSVEWLWAGIKL
jgi:hypothetical protein